MIISLLRQLADQQQYIELQNTAFGLWIENNDPQILPLLALAYAHTGQWLLANETLTQVQEYQADLPPASLIDIAAVLIVLQRIEAAEQLLSTALQQLPEHGLGQARLAFCRMLQGDLAAAKSLFEQAAIIEPERIPIRNFLAQLYLQQKDYVQAQRVVDQALSLLAGIQATLSNVLYQQYSQLLLQLQLQIWVAEEAFAQAEEWLQEQHSLQQQCEIEEQQFVYWVGQYSRLLAESDHHQQATEILRNSLKTFPDNTALCLQLAELAQVQGQFMPAINLLNKALKKDPDNIPLWVQLANASLHRFDKKARQAAEKAVALASALKEDVDHPLHIIKMQQAQAKNALAQVESHEQNFSISEPLFLEILADHAYFVPALQGLGQQYLQQGKIDEALALFERIKAVDPIKGITSLISARRYPEDEETLEKMAKAAEKPSLEGTLRSSILFQLAAAWEKRKDYDKAFGFAEKANAAAKKFLPYDAKAHRNMCARIRMSFCKALYEHRAGCGIDSTVPVYVLGMPRSGTTLVEQILSGHSDIFGAGELGVIPQVIQGLNRWERHVGSGRSYPDCVDDLTPYITAGIANNVLKELQEYAPEARHIVDKLPHNFENIGLIKFLFPRAKIISVRRDPRDIAISNYFTDYQAKHGGMGFAYDLQSIGEQLADHNLLMHHWHQTFPGEILELNYEDVVDDLEGSARKMLAYIGVEWQPEVLKFNELERTVKTASVWQVRQPIYKTSKAKWQRYEKYLSPLLKGTNAKILPDPYEMLTLPEPGFLQTGVELYKKGDLDGAELNFKKMLHHNPVHAACHYMLGLVYLSKGHLQQGIVEIETALEKSPWHKEWRDNLGKAYVMAGEHEKAAELEKRFSRKRKEVDEADNMDDEWPVDSEDYVQQV
jgi:tetratricopeptide (TPR) repeat protein